MKILILRTIAHNRIWEGGEPTCHYEALSKDIIKKWEPDIVKLPFNEFNYGIGIYTKMYYSYSPSAYTGTDEEHHPSLLKLEPISDGSSFYGKETLNPNEIRIAFSFVRKILEIDKNKMLNIDDLLYKEKMRQLKIDYNFTRFPSLCFTLDENSVTNVFRQAGVNLNLS